jgi:glycogen operon protein
VAITSLRRRQLRNFFLTLMLSQGVPMIRSGDEFGHTQGGNNNAYCQDNSINWLNWDAQPWQQVLCAFVAQTTRLRAAHPVLQRRQFFQGRPIRGASARDLTWLTRDGKPMKDSDWHAARARVLAFCLNGHIEEVDDRGQPIVGTTLLALFNAEDREILFHLPALERHQYWQPVLDTNRAPLPRRRCRGGQGYTLPARSCAVLELRRQLLGVIRRWGTLRNGSTPAVEVPRVTRSP